MVERLQVLMNGERVGYFDRTESGAHHFSYVPSWLESAQSRPISLSMPLQQSSFQGKEVINFFDNLLPDHPQIRAKIASRFKANTQQPFDLLAKIGRDAAGAITLLSEDEEIPNHQIIQATPLNKTELAHILQSYQQNSPLGMFDERIDFRISIAGAQEKTALLWHNGEWHLPHGLTPTTHIFKLPIGEIRTPKHTLDLSTSVDNELICLRLFSAFNIPTAHADILDINDTRALIVKRFDRRLSQNQSYYLRLPFEDCCQAFGLAPTQKYESDGGVGINDIMHKLLFSSHENDRTQFMQTQFLFWVLGAIDGHAKNFSLAIERQGRYRLSPVYDVLSAYPMLGGKGWHSSDLQMAMSLRSTQKGKKWLWSKIRTEHFIKTAEVAKFSTSQMKQIIEQVCDTTQHAIDIVATSLPKNINEDVRDQIFEGVKKQAKKVII